MRPIYAWTFETATCVCSINLLRRQGIELSRRSGIWVAARPGSGAGEIFRSESRYLDQRSCAYSQTYAQSRAGAAGVRERPIHSVSAERECAQAVGDSAR